MTSSPVIDIQKEAGATFGEAYGWQIPSVYSSVEGEYTAANNAVGLVDRSYVGRLGATGGDALDLIHRLSTNDLLPLQANEGAYTVFTSPKGRIVDYTLVLRQEDRLLLLTAPENRQKVIDWIDFYTFAEDIEVQDVTEDTAMFSLLGPKATEMLGHVAGQGVSSMSMFSSVSATIGGVEATIIRTDFAGLTGYDIVVETSDASNLWAGLPNSGESYGVKPVGAQALEVIRVERGIPAYGRELSEDYNPLEANLMDVISFTKGCYTGQEVVTRLNTYKKVQKYLVGLSWDGDYVPPADKYLTLDGKRAGKITSAVRSLRLNRPIALGYVRKEQAEAGSTLTMDSPNGEIEVGVEELPFIG